MKHQSGTLVLGLVAGITLLSAGPIPAQQTREVVRVTGSAEVARTISSYAAEFMNTYPDCNVVVSGGSRINLEALAKKEAELVMASRKISADERASVQKEGMGLDEAFIGYCGLVVIVPPSNPVNELTLDQVRKIFTGEYDTWDKVGGQSRRVSVMVVRPGKSGIVDAAVQEFFKAPLHRNADTRPDFRTVIKAVFWEENAIGMVRLEDVQRLSSLEPEAKIKMLGIKKDVQSPPVLPIFSAIDSGTYPFSLPCYLYMDTKQVGRMARQLFSYCAKRGGKP